MSAVEAGIAVAFVVVAAAGVTRPARCVPEAFTGDRGLAANLHVRRLTCQLGYAPSQGGSAGSKPLGASNHHRHHPAADL